MLNELLDFLGNSHFEGWIASPLMGLIFAAILFGLGKPPDANDKGESPKDVKHEIEVYIRQKEVHHYHDRNGNSGTGDDNFVVFVILILVAAIGLFLLTAYLPAVSYALHMFNVATAVFCLATVVLMIAGGRFNTPQWWLRGVFPAIASLACFWLTIEAREGIRSDVVAYAGSLIANEPMSLSHVLNAAIAFFKAIGGGYALWIELIGAAFICIAACSLIVLLQCVHYVSLSNLRAGGTGIWIWLAVKTERFGGGESVLLATTLLVIGGLLATGTVYGWIHPSVSPV
ncbi:hypothetical protein [Paraburkholderia adhaesiva]|uniref:hypothetical protein n=1 Tax=Paraburkholderia adhaesiva TaxID=2883244 RepID=UPI001F3D51C0|nr:hypothetical protein [Paraburkholderia adhaesiva]